MQSSITAINSGAKDYILSLIDHSKEYIVVFNEIRAQYWLKPEVQSQVIEEQNSKAIEHLAKRLGVNPPCSFRINAAQAWDSKNKRFQADKLLDGFTLEKLYADSHIQELKNEIFKLCRNNVTEILDKNALSSLKEWIKATQDLEGFIKLQEEIKQQWELDCEKWHDAIDQKVGDIHLAEEGEDGPRTIQEALAEVKENIKKLFKESIEKVKKCDIKDYLGNDYDKTKREQYASVDKKLLEKICGEKEKNVIGNKSRILCKQFVEKLRAMVENQIDFRLSTQNNESMLLYAANYTRELEDVKVRISSSHIIFKIVPNEEEQPLISWIGRLWISESAKRNCCSDYIKDFQKRFDDAVEMYSESHVNLIASWATGLSKTLQGDWEKWQEEHTKIKEKVDANIEFIHEFQKDLSALEEARKRIYQS